MRSCDLVSQDKRVALNLAQRAVEGLVMASALEPERTDEAGT